MKPSKYKKDQFHQKAQKNGYRARSAYKLIQLDEHYHFLDGASSVLDLGCAPGSWLQVLKERLNDDAIIVGVDHTRVAPIEGVVIIKSDVKDRNLPDKLKETFPDGIDLVLSDMAPNTSGNKSLDGARSSDLVRRAVQVSLPYLNDGAHFVGKVFQNPEMYKIKRDLKRIFKKVRITKPKASRKSNRELYIVAKSKKKA